MCVDYFSRYPEIALLSSVTSQGVIIALKKIFSRHGVPERVRSDNGPQFSAQEFQLFSQKYGFTHITSSPHYPQSNGLVERTIQTIKKILLKSEDPFMALLNFRSTPLSWTNHSPAELLMGRPLRANLPQTTRQLIPKWDYIDEFRKRDEEIKRKQKRDYDTRHRARTLPPLENEMPVWVDTRGKRTHGTVVSQDSAPRSYIVETETGTLRRNRSQLNPSPPGETSSNSQPIAGPSESPTRTSPIATRSRTGTAINPPDRFTPQYYN